MAQTKDNSRRNILLVGVALLSGFALFARKKQAIQNLDYRIKDVRFSRIENIFEILALKLKVNLEINNPSSTFLGFKSFVGRLNYNGNDIGSFKLYDPITLLPERSTSIAVPVTVSSLSVLTEIYKAMKDGVQKNIQVTGLLKVGALDIPVNETVNFTMDGK